MEGIIRVLRGPEIVSKARPVNVVKVVDSRIAVARSIAGEVVNVAESRWSEGRSVDNVGEEVVADGSESGERSRTDSGIFGGSRPPVDSLVVFDVSDHCFSFVSSWHRNLSQIRKCCCPCCPLSPLQ